jgi:hypothetical protein
MVLLDNEDGVRSDEMGMGTIDVFRACCRAALLGGVEAHPTLPDLKAAATIIETVGTAEPAPPARRLPALTTATEPRVPALTRGNELQVAIDTVDQPQVAIDTVDHSSDAEPQVPALTTGNGPQVATETIDNVSNGNVVFPQYIEWVAPDGTVCGWVFGNWVPTAASTEPNRPCRTCKGMMLRRLDLDGSGDLVYCNRHKNNPLAGEVPFPEEVLSHDAEE